MRLKRHCFRNVERYAGNEGQNDVSIVSADTTVQIIDTNAEGSKGTGLVDAFIDR